MKQELNYNRTQRAGYTLHMVWRTLKQVPFMCLTRTDSPSQMEVFTASDRCEPVPLWSGCQAVISRSAGDGALC